MAPKDIRAFFGGTVPVKGKSTASDGANAGAASPKKPKASPGKPAAKSPAKAASAPPNGSGKAAAGGRVKKRKAVELTVSPAKRVKDSDENERIEPASQTRGGRKQARRKVLVETDSDDDWEPVEAPVIEVDSTDDEVCDAPPPQRKRSKSSEAAPAGAASATLPSPAAKRHSSAPTKTADAAAPTASKKGGAPASTSAGAPSRARAQSRKSAADRAFEGLSEQGCKAVAAVKAATDCLPSEADLLESGRVTVRAEAAGGWGGGGGGDAPPPNAGAKSHPVGHPDCLTNLTFVISGVLDSMQREEAKDYVQRHGGRVTGSVSGKTTFLLCGKDTGTKKLTTAREKGVQLIDEDGLLALVQASASLVGTDPSASMRAPSAVAVATASSHGAAAGVAPAAPADSGSQLWVDKWKPKTAADLVGNPGLQATIRQWLADWGRVHLGGEAPRAAPGSAGARRDMSKKALLVSGPPGTGKTSASHIIATELGFDIVEVNASDTRSKADASSKMKNGIAGKLSNRVKELVNNTAIGAGDGNTSSRRQVLVMDEVDGMSGGDRGGVSDLILSIKASRMPIICICNDKYKTSLRSLRNHCLELDWRKPTKLQVAQRLMSIARAEGLALNQVTLDALVESSQGDIRVMLGQLQMHRLSAASLSYDDVKRGAQKDMDKSPFECARKLLSVESAPMPMTDRFDCAFQDMDLVPLLVQENYLNHRPSLAHNEATAMQVIAKAADAFSAGDLLTTRVRRFQEWHLMPTAALMSSVYPAAYMRGPRETFFPGEMNFPRFTSWLGHNSSANKQKRIAHELNTKLLAAGAAIDRRDLRLQYLPVLRLALTAPLASRGADGIDDVLELMQRYLISREDVDAIIDMTKFKTQSTWGADPMKLVETKVKSAFTRSFNKQGLPVKCTVMVEDGKKTKRSARGASAAAPDTEPGLGDELEDAAAVNANDESDAEEEGPDPSKMGGVDFTAAVGKGKGKTSRSAGASGARRGGRGGSAGAARGRGKGKGKSA